VISLQKRAALVVVFATLILALPGSAGAGTMQRPYNPTANITATPNFLSSGKCAKLAGIYTCVNPCVTSRLTWPVHTNSVACTTYILAAINQGAAREHRGPVVLPANWYTLSVAQQLFVIADIERVLRGYPAYLGINTALSAEALSAARRNADPRVAPGFRVGNDAEGVEGMGGAWSQGFNVLAADYVWMYADGWGGSTATTSNVACTSAGAKGCWAHRDELLGADPGFNPGVGLRCSTCEMGTAFVVVDGQSSYVDLVELPGGRSPAMTFTWAHELSFFPAGTWREPTTTTVGPTTSTGVTTTTTTSTINVTGTATLSFG
jgi:hypothetical protein